MATRHSTSPSGTRRSCRRAMGDSFRKLHPRTMARNPVMFVVEVGSVLTTLTPDSRRRHAAAATSASSCRSPSGSGSPCCSPISPRRWPKAAARRRPTRCGGRRPRPSPTRSAPTDRTRSCRRRRCARATRAGRGRRGHSRRRRDHRGRRVGGRERHHRRVGAGHPRIGRRPFGGDRRHQGAVRLDSGAHHRQSRARRSSTG